MKKAGRRSNDNERESGGDRNGANGSNGGVVVSNRFSGRHGLGKPER